MEKTQSIVEITKALIAFHKEVPAIKKSSENPYFKSKYAALENIIATVEPVLSKHSLTFVQFPSGDHGLTTILMHSSGEFIQDTYTMTPAKNDPQGTGSAITYQKRYALAAVLGLKIEDEDDDGNDASGHGKPPVGGKKPFTKATHPPSAAEGDQEERFNKAKRMVKGSKNTDGLLDYQEKLKTSNGFTPEQRKELNALVELRIEELQNG